MPANRKYEELSYSKNQKMCHPILVTLLKMRPHYSQSSRENATPSSGTSPSASYKEAVPPRGLRPFIKQSLFPDSRLSNKRIETSTNAETKLFSRCTTNVKCMITVQTGHKRVLKRFILNLTFWLLTRLSNSIEHLLQFFLKKKRQSFCHFPGFFQVWKTGFQISNLFQVFKTLYELPLAKRGGRGGFCSGDSTCLPLNVA